MTLPLISLAYLTAVGLAPPEAISLAAELGYDAVGLRATPSAPGGPFSRLIEDKALLAETCRRSADTGVAVFDVEIVRLNAGFTVQSVLPFLEVCAALKAKAVLVAGDDADEARLTESFARFCAAALPFGVSGNLEFMPWTMVRDCKTAQRIVAASGAANGKVLVDALHVARSTTTLDDIAALPRDMLAYAQICDAPAEIPATDEGLIHTARAARLLPGQGGIDLAAMFAQLPPDLPVSVEIPNEAGVAKFGAKDWARQALAATKQVLAAR
jgi:sugar phosphate isomerase/epimerase